MIIPHRGKYLAEIILEDEVSSGGVIIAQSMKMNPKHSKARVISVGSPEIDENGKELSIVAKEEYIVHYKQSRGTRYTEIGGRKLIFLRRDQILAYETLKSSQI